MSPSLQPHRARARRNRQHESDGLSASIQANESSMSRLQMMRMMMRMRRSLCEPVSSHGSRYTFAFPPRLFTRKEEEAAAALEKQEEGLLFSSQLSLHQPRESDLISSITSKNHFRINSTLSCLKPLHHRSTAVHSRAQPCTAADKQWCSYFSGT